jgi:hypothetical protein
MKQLLSLFLFLLPCLAWGQYPTNGNQKITLGEQTSADGLIYRGVLGDTALITPLSDTSAYIILDTVNHRFYNYNRATNVWSVAGGGTAVTTFSGGTTGLTPSTATSGAVTLNGTLAVANGGTGSATQNFVDLTTTQSSIGGAKTFTSALTATRFNPTSSTVTGTGMYLPSANTLGFSTNSIERIQIQSDGDVGIGATPFDGYNFQISTNSGSGNEVIFVVNNVGTSPSYLTTARFDFGVFSDVSNYVASNTVLGQTNFIGQANDARYVAAKIDAMVTNAGNVGRGAGHSGILRFYTKPTNANGAEERMRIIEDGDLLVGYTTDNGAYKLQVNSQIFATNATIATSDIRFKENIQPLDKGLEIINKLKPVKFNFITTTKNNFSEFDEIGFIAQDVEGALSTELFAKAVVKKFDEGKEDSALGLMTEKFIPILVKAIQEQQALIKALEQRIINLENK